MSSHQNVEIRRATRADVETISSFNAALARETESRMLDGSLLRAGVESVLEDPQKGWYAVAVSHFGLDQATIIGQILVTFEWSDWRNGHFWWLQSLYVDPHSRQQGVFRQLYEYVCKQAQANSEKVCGFRLYVEQDNHLAHQAYAHIGFQKTAYQMHEIDFSAQSQPSPTSAS
jgi:GNAT superfamily N-acetyltransferase